ncbi:TPA: hypothetical protein ACKRET_000843 [Proteus mirabilis]
MAQLKVKVEQIVAVWDGVWLNPEDGNQELKLQCVQGHLINTRPFYLHQELCLSSEYINSRRKLTWQYAEGHIWESTYHCIMSLLPFKYYA